jgi:site-specific recombinase
MEAILQSMAVPSAAGALEHLVRLVGSLRPRQPEDGLVACNNLRALCYLLEKSAPHRAALRAQLFALLLNAKQVHLYTDTGILSNETLMTTVKRRIGHRVLPPAFNPEYLKDLFGAIFHRADDYRWLEAIPAEIWQEFVAALHLEEDAAHPARIATRLQLLEAIQILACRIAAIGLEPELVRNCPEIERFESPFVRQQVEALAFVESARVAIAEHLDPQIDTRHIHVLFDQCEEIIARVRKNARVQGVSVALTYHLQRLAQHIERCRLLLALVDPDDAVDAHAAPLTLFLTLVRAENRKNSVRDVFRENTELLALQVTEHASHTGEHYVAETRSQWRAMFRSAAGAGLIVAVMALIKSKLGGLHLPPVWEAVAFSLNYGLGFVLVHMLGFTIATKQPAMTAAHIAAALPARRGRQDSLDGIVELIVKVFRTQFIAILGNVLIVVPVALLIAWVWHYETGAAVVTVQKAGQMLHDLRPFLGLAIPHAAIAGICLFLAGLISGYYDNKAQYNRIPERIARHPALVWLVGERRARKIARYIEHNLGALAGNFYFGCMLGSIATLGFLLGLPLDIRHITFSAANFAYALESLDYHVIWPVVMIASAGIALIGLTNLVVSFTLALWVAMRARKRSLRELAPVPGLLWRRFWRRPADFYFPPRDAARTETEEGHGKKKD